ncbi:MAG: hypothetical protein ACFBZ8_08955 [Opitutales bacterium]
MFALIAGAPLAAQAGSCLGYGFGYRSYARSSFGHPFFGGHVGHFRSHGFPFRSYSRVYVRPYFRPVYRDFPGYYRGTTGETAIARSQAAYDSANSADGSSRHVSSGSLTSRYLESRQAQVQERTMYSEAEPFDADEGRALLRQRFLAE